MSAVVGGPLQAYHGIHVAVFGATGFIGRWVCRALVEHGARAVLVVRDRVAGEQLRLQLGESASVVECDIENRSAVARLMKTLEPAIVFNLAGYGVDRRERDDATMFRVNAWFVDSLCDALYGLASSGWSGLQLVQAGTQLEYGPVSGLVHEQLEPQPDTVYGESKLQATRAVAEYGMRGLRCVVARLFTVYGPGEQRPRLLASLLETASTRQPLQLTTGDQRLDFTYVEDVAEGLLRLGLCETSAGGAVNLARGELVQVREFVHRAAEILHIPHDLLRFGALPSRPEEMRYSGVSNVRLRELTHWAPPTDVAAGIRRTLERSIGSNALA